MPTSESIVALLVVFVSFYFVRLIQLRRNSNVHLLPMPGGSSWIWGHEMHTYERTIGRFWGETFDALGPIFRLKGSLIHPDIVLTTDPALLSHMFSKHAYSYPKSKLIRDLIERLVGRGLVWATGETHKRQRQMLNGLFTTEKLRRMSADIWIACSAFEARINQQIRKENGSAVIDVIGALSTATLDMIGRVGFRHDFCEGGGTQEVIDIPAAWKDQLTSGSKKSTFIAERVLRSFPFLARLPLPGFDAQKRIPNTIRRLAASKLLDPNSGNENADNFLSIMMAARATESKGVSNDELLDQIATFVIAGQETTSSVLAHTLFELARAPEKQDRLRDEIAQYGKEEPTYDDFHKDLPYLDAVCKEGLRLYPSIPYMERVAARDDVLPLRDPVITPSGQVLTELRVQAGQVFFIPIISINRSNATWSDGDTFRPERWLRSDLSLSNFGWNGLGTFGDGTTSCIGYRLAVFEIKVLLYALIRRFVFHDTGAVLHSKSPVTMATFVQRRFEEGVQIPLRVTRLDG